MDLSYVQRELRILSEIVEGWTASGHVGTLERDLVLEKLRALYETVRFSSPSQSAEKPADLEDKLNETSLVEPQGSSEPLDRTAPIEVPPSIDLGAALSLEPRPFESAATEDDAEEQPNAIVDHTPIVLTDEVVGAEASACNVEPAHSLQEEPTVVAATSSNPEKSDSSAPETSADAALQSDQPLTQTLFEVEAETDRHAFNQRFIMSLYDSEVPVRESAARRKETPARQNTTPPATDASIDAAPTVATPSQQAVTDTANAKDIGASDQPQNETATSQTDSAEPITAAPEIVEPTADAVTSSVKEPVSAESQPEQAAPAAQTESGAAAESIPAAYAEEELHRAESSAQSTPKTEVQPQVVDEEFDIEEITLPKPIQAAGAEEGTVLGDVINRDAQTLADTIARPRASVADRRSEPVTDLRAAIGINDKFLVIRDLFDGDSEAFEKAIAQIDSFDNLDDCMVYIAEHYAWNANSDGAKFLMDLLEQKFS